MPDKQPTTLTALLHQAVETHKKSEFMRYKESGAWHTVSATEFEQRVRSVALGLYSLGVRKGDRVALLAESSFYWTLADYGIIATGAINVPIYPTQALNQVEYILKESQPKLLIVSNYRQVKRIDSALKHVPDLKLVTFEKRPDEHAIDLATIEGAGRELAQERPDLYDKIASDIRSDDLASIIYTSGTTGEPKGVMLSHDNLIFDAIQTGEFVKPTADDIALTFLPLSHIFERMVIYLYIHFGVTICYAESVEAVVNNLAEIRPTIMTSVPRLFEKMYERIMKKADKLSKNKRKLFDWAMKVGVEWAKLKDERKPIIFTLSIQHKLASKLVFSKWREAVGGRMQRMVAGGAALPSHIGYAFWAAGLPILQGYGLTETSPVIAVNTMDDNKIGTVGKQLPGVELKLAEDGEICTRGRQVMVGYFNKPAETREVIDQDGWFKTGDIGQFDEHGFLQITDRKKDLMKLSIGKYIAPQPIENMLRQSDLIEQALIIAHQRKYPVALIVPNLENLRAVAKSKGLPLDDLTTNPQVIEHVKKEVAGLTKSLADYERIKKIAILPKEFTVEGGELTPTLKVRRRIVEDKYKDLINSLYPSSELSAVGGE
ncbi:MAG TPA: long-chain fatty acid--CoA ligase [Blastocatellia bacterium]|nr:long-chain fatty acid--CoA ligase [Blastocatellia bacterium]